MFNSQTAYRQRKQPEVNLQKSCVMWFRYQYPKYSKLLIHVPNGGFRNTVEAAKFKAIGVTAGVADLLLLVSRNGYGCLAIEMKTTDGRQSDNQKNWQNDMIDAGNRYEVCRSVDEFISIVNSYISGK